VCYGAAQTAKIAAQKTIRVYCRKSFRKDAERTKQDARVVAESQALLARSKALIAASTT